MPAGGVVQSVAACSDAVLGRVEQLCEELVPPGVGTVLQQLRVGVERRGEEVGGGELVGAGLPEPLALGDEVAAAPQAPLVDTKRGRVGRGRRGRFGRGDRRDLVRRWAAWRSGRAA